MKNTRFKRLGAMLVSLALMLAALPTLVFAADPSLIDPNEPGSITIHKYSIDDMDNAGEAALGNELAAGQLPSTASPLGGVPFRVVRVDDDTANLDGLKAAIASGDVGDINDEIDALASTANAYSQTVTTDTSGIARFGSDGITSSLDQGIYLVVELPYEIVDSPVDPFYVSIPTTHPDGEQWIYDVHVYPKNTMDADLYITKTITNETNKYDSYSVTDTFKWYLMPEIPLTIDRDYSKYTVTDTLPDELKYYYDTDDEDAVEEVYVKKADDSSKLALTIATDYTVNVAGKVLTIDLTAAGMAKMQQAIGATTTVDTLPVLYIVIKTEFDLDEFDEDTQLATDIVNKVKLEWTATFGSGNDTDEASVHTGGLEILKYETGDETKTLRGARFIIYSSQTDAENDTDALVDPRTGEEWIVTTDADGKASFWGLEYGAANKAATASDVGTTSYWLVEIRAPYVDQSLYAAGGYDAENEADAARYNLVGKPIEVKVGADTHTTIAATSKIANSKGLVLPVTGGMGTTLFTLVGIGLICAAAIVLVVSRKHGKAK